MAFRWFQRRTLQKLWSFNNQSSQKFYLHSGHSWAIYNYTNDSKFIRYLHLKVYDKDVSLEDQRFANKQIREPVIANKIEKENLSNNVTNTTESKDKDADIFGTSTTPTEKEEDGGDLEEEEFIKNPKRRALRPIDYARIIKSHLNEKRLKDAIAVLEVQMLKQDRAKPEPYLYNLLISGCAKHGYTRKAFNLFTKMRQRGFQIKGGTYTSLFSACANAPSTAYGLEQANRLREIMLEKGYTPNIINYNAMIKAYGRCGDVKTAYMLADEIIEKRLPLTNETFNFLLQACASDPEFGFRHCLLTWHKMLQHGYKPDYYTFNTVLRCVRDCGFGDLDTMEQVLKQIFAERKLINPPGGSEDQTKYSDEVHNLPDLKQKSDAINIKNEASQLEMPNLLSMRPHLGSLVSLAEVNSPHERFLLLGGLTGFLNLMKENRVTPGIETFTTLLEVIPPTYAAEKQLISFIRKIGLKCDIDFFNILIKKRSLRFDYEGAKEVISMIRTAGLQPDIVTYGVLALGCQTENEANELLQQMKGNGIRMNAQILGAMLRQGTANRNFPYIISVLQISLDENIKPNDVFVTHLHKFYDRCARSIDERHPSTKSKSFKNGHAKFCDKLRIYYEEQGISGLKLEDAIRKLREHPYKQFKDEEADGVEPLKNQAISKKQKIRKYIKKIKLDNLRNDISDPIDYNVKIKLQ